MLQCRLFIMTSCSGDKQLCFSKLKKIGYCCQQGTREYHTRFSFCNSLMKSKDNIMAAQVYSGVFVLFPALQDFFMNNNYNDENAQIFFYQYTAFSSVRFNYISFVQCYKFILSGRDIHPTPICEICVFHTCVFSAVQSYSIYHIPFTCMVWLLKS